MVGNLPLSTCICIGKWTLHWTRTLIMARQPPVRPCGWACPQFLWWENVMHASRVGLSILSRVGLESFATSTPQEYVAKATSTAENLQALAKIRSSLRERTASSVLCNAKGFARNVEAAYRKMWRRWCQRCGADVTIKELSPHTQHSSTDEVKQPG
jgi:hypothetical protein